MDGATKAYVDVDLFIRLDQIGAALSLVFVVAANLFVVQLSGVWLIVPFLILLNVGLAIAHRSLAQGHVGRALGWVAASNWVVAVAVPALFPFLWPIMALTVLMPLIVASPHLSRTQILPAIVATAIVASAVATIGLLNDDGGVIDDIDDAIELVIVVGALVAQIVPIALVAWQHNELQRLSESRLAESRDRVVTAADTERRRIERDLHDGAQQRLVALGVRLRLLKSQGHDDPVVTNGIDTVIDELDAAISEVRELAHGIYPPLLQTRGLPDALAAVGRRSPLNLNLEVDDIERLDVPVETALYFTALEALTNAAKHAPDASVELRLDGDAEQLVLSVSDDGAGFDMANVQASHGFDNMSDRLAVVGGALRVDSQPGHGTTITATVPR